MNKLMSFMSGAIILSTVSSASLAQSDVYPAAAIPTFKCRASVTRYLVDRTGKHIEIDSDLVSMDVVPFYFPNPNGPIEFPAPKDQVRFQKYPIFTKPEIVIFFYSKDLNGKPDNRMEISLLTTFSDSANPIQYPQIYPAPISTTSLKNVSWNLEKHLEGIYAYSNMNAEGNQYYNFSTYCDVKAGTPANTPLTNRNKSRKMGMKKVGNKLIPILR